jgi:bifunctional DNase/RNase
MVEVTIDSIRVSLMSNHRIIILKDSSGDRYLPIWIGPCEADSITVTLQEQEVPRPLTHDLLKAVITEMGGIPQHVAIHALRNDIFYAKIVIRQNGRTIEIDSRSSDAIAFAVRVKVPILVDESVMELAATSPDEEVGQAAAAAEAPTDTPDERLSIFRDYIDSLDMDDMPDEDRPN